MKTQDSIKLLILLIFHINIINCQADSGGDINPQQAAYDVNYYHLDLNIDPVNQSIDGTLLCKVRILESIDELVLDLDNPFIVSSVSLSINEGMFSEVGFVHSNYLLSINIPEVVDVNDIVQVQVTYSGTPRISESPPWEAGFVWETSDNGHPWIAVACELDGADVWWPCKDHPSDEPDSMHISLTVPNPLTCVSNGILLSSEDNGDNTSTFHWFVSTPINNYNVTFAAGDFVLIEDNYQSLIGYEIPFKLWVLPESYIDAVNHMDVFLAEFNFLENICGPFPFGMEKHGWVEVPFAGMEHQTIIAYGSSFSTSYYGFDFIHYHELAHEWWGNLITAKSWSDVWIHEGIATYTEALYVEYLQGTEAYHQYMLNKRLPDYNYTYPLAPIEEVFAYDGFMALKPYRRGACVMHTLRYHLGDVAFFDMLKRWAYPDLNDYDNSNGRQCRIVNTDDLKNEAEVITGIDLDPFFDVFFRETTYPYLIVERANSQTEFRWETESGVLLDVNVPVLVNGMPQTVSMNQGQGTLNVGIAENIEIDPDQWILMSEPTIIVSLEERKDVDVYLAQNYPNPFKNSTTIEFSISKPQHISIKLYNVLGEEVETLIDRWCEQGEHKMVWDNHKLESGCYFYTMQYGNKSLTKRMFID